MSSNTKNRNAHISIIQISHVQKEKILQPSPSVNLKFESDIRCLLTNSYNNKTSERMHKIEYVLTLVLWSLQVNFVDDFQTDDDYGSVWK